MIFLKKELKLLCKPAGERVKISTILVITMSLSLLPQQYQIDPSELYVESSNQYRKVHT